MIIFKSSLTSVTNIDVASHDETTLALSIIQFYSKTSRQVLTKSEPSICVIGALTIISITRMSVLIDILWNSKLTV